MNSLTVNNKQSIGCEPYLASKCLQHSRPVFLGWSIVTSGVGQMDLVWDCDSSLAGLQKLDYKSVFYFIAVTANALNIN